MLLPLLLSPLLWQNPPPPPTPREAPAPAVQPAAQVLVPGAIPEGASPEARELFQKLCAATLAPKALRVPIQGFDLWVDAEVRSSANQSNEATTLRYRYQSPGFMRATTQRQRELLRGPKGDFLIDPVNKYQQPLAVGREGEEDRKQLAEALDLARNFVALSDPAALRIGELRTVSVDPLQLPEALRAAAGGLVWLEILSPDFRLPNSSGNVRVKLGLRRDKSLPELCLVGPERSGPGAPPTSLIRALDYREKQGLIVPWNLELYGRDESGRALQAKPGLKIWLKRDSDLHPQFSPETFNPG